MKQKIARAILRLFGWSMVGTPPVERRFVLIAAPHTSNWDFPLMLLYAMAFGVKVNWLAKHTLFFPGANWIMRALLVAGGANIDLLPAARAIGDPARVPSVAARGAGDHDRGR